MPTDVSSVFGGRSIKTARSAISQNSSSKGETQRLTEDLVPISKSRVSPYHPEQPDVDATVNRERLELRVNLLSAFPPHGPPFKKSWINVNSYSGTVKIVMFRLSGSENHFFRISVMAEKADVVLTLPQSFRGIVGAYDHHNRRARLSAPSVFRQRVERGFIRLNDPGRNADEFEDEVLVKTSGRVEFRLMSAEVMEVSGTGNGSASALGAADLDPFARGFGGGVRVDVPSGYANGHTNGYSNPNGTGNGYGDANGYGGAGFALGQSNGISAPTLAYGNEKPANGHRSGGFGTIKRLFKKLS